ncbi:MAG TPA: hypothetical protein GXZ48_06470 [Acholeplasmataceae bacterium]|nr:hypothetical protein [Acholeplasmataceae bacterium]
MEQKIKDYVDYHFRFDTRDDIEELKAEIIANLIDRYHDNLKSGKDKEEAYIDAIKQMGDFNTEEANEYKIKPSIADVSLLIASILSVFGLLIMFVNMLVGSLITVISIGAFSGASYYLYSNSQYYKQNYMDIETHHLLLSKIYKWMKTCFTFWTISISILISSIIVNILSDLALIDIINEPSLGNIEELIILLIVIFIIVFIVVALIFIKLYQILMNKYYYLTGKKSPKSMLSDSLTFLNGEKLSIKRIVNSKLFLSIFGLIIMIITLCFTLYVEDLYSGSSSSGPLFLMFDYGHRWAKIMLAILLIQFFAIHILSFYKRDLKNIFLVISEYGLYSGILIYITHISKIEIRYFGRPMPRYEIDSGIYVGLIISIIFYTLIVAGLFIRKMRKKK